MFSPIRTKYRKYQKGKIAGVAPNTMQLLFGRYGLKSCSEGILPAHTIYAARLAITRRFRRSGKIWIRVFPDIQVTAKPAEVRMGKGKGYPCAIVVDVSSLGYLRMRTAVNPRPA